MNIFNKILRNIIQMAKDHKIKTKIINEISKAPTCFGTHTFYQQHYEYECDECPWYNECIDKSKR